MRDTIRGIPVGNRARERIGYLMRDATTSAWQSVTVRSRSRRARQTCHGYELRPTRFQVSTLVVRTNATRVKFMFPPHSVKNSTRSSTRCVVYVLYSHY
jgi:hypothetical protein